MAGTGDGSSITQRRKSIKRSSRRGKVHSRQDIVVATWNVRTLVEDAGGDRRICRSRPVAGGQKELSTEARPASGEPEAGLPCKGTEAVWSVYSCNPGDEMVWKRCVATHRFHTISSPNGYTFFHSGRPLPCAEETAVRNEGVGIMLDERASAAWREAGEAWEAISSRVVTARLKAMGRGQRRPGGARTTRNSFISVISAYAPTARAPPGIKSKFMEELQDVLDKVPSSDLLLLLGDFNARVGCSDTNGELWRGIRGRYGIGAGNEAGDRLLEFCAVNQLTVMQRNNRMPMSESLTKCCMITHITPTGQQSTTGVH